MNIKHPSLNSSPRAATRVMRSACCVLALVIAGRATAAELSPFLQECATLAETAAKANQQTVVGRDGWLFFAPELRHLGVGKFWGPEAASVSRASKPEFADPLPAILDFKAQLDKAGVELLLAPVPAKTVISFAHISTVPMAMSEPPPRQDVVHREFFDELQRTGVKVIDLTPPLLRARNGEHGAAFCQTDTHWSGAGLVTAAEVIAAEVKKVAGPRAAKSAFKTEWKPVTFTGDLANGAGASVGKETLSLRFVADAGGRAPEPDRASPVILLGDSHNLIFHAGDDMHAKGAGLPDQLAAELGYPVDLLAVRGSGATPARVNLLRRVRENPSYLDGKAVVVWCFTVREFTESTGWQKVPIVK
jgi:alginate O-acetyltransferase complex protein AlgJ